MDLTPNFDIGFPDDADPLSVEALMAAMATTIDEALGGAPVADLAALALITPPADNWRKYVTELKATFISIGGVWVQAGQASFATVAARNTAYAKASGAYLVAGASAKTADLIGVNQVYGGASVGWLGNSAFPRLRQVARTATQTFGTSASTPVLIQIDAPSVINMGDIGYNGSPTYGMVAPLTGEYEAVGLANFAPNGSGNRALAYQVNGAATTYLANTLGTASQGTYFGGVRNLHLNSGDVVTLLAWQTSGGSLNLQAAELSL